MKALFTSINLIGDALYIGPALREWLYHNYIPGDEIYLHTLNDHITCLYRGMLRDWTEDNPPDQRIPFHIVFERPAINFEFEHCFNVNKAFSLSDAKKQHIAQSYADLLGVTLPIPSPDYAKSSVNAGTPYYRPQYKPIFVPSSPRPKIDATKTIMISMFSMSCQSRDKNHPGLPPNKMLPWPKWKPILRYLRSRFPDHRLLFLGSKTDRAPSELAIPENEYLTGVPLDDLALAMRDTTMLVTIDNGMGHLAATQDTPTFLLYPMCLGTHYILPIGNPNLHWIQMNPVTIDPVQIRTALDRAVNQILKQSDR